MAFPVVLNGCESWTIKKAERRRIDAFELWCWKRLLRVPWTVRRSNQFILKEIQPVHSKGDQSWVFIRRTDAKDKTPILWTSDVKTWLTGKTLMLGKIEGERRRTWQRMRRLDGITNLMDMSLSKRQELVMVGRPDVLWFMVSQRVGHNWATELNWTELLLWSSMWAMWATVVAAWGL